MSEGAVMAHNTAMEDLTSRIPRPHQAAPSLVEGIRMALGDSIAKGIIPAGYRLTEISLAEHFGCSTTPVREAIRKLEAEGLVKIYPRRGAEVTSVGVDDLKKLYEVRMVLECHAVRRAAERVAAGDTGGVRAARQLVERQRRFLDGSEPASAPIDSQVHAAIAELAGNDVMAGMIGTATRQIEAVQARSGALVADWEPAVVAHERVLDEIEAGNADAAERLMREHLEQAAAMVLDAHAKAQAASRA